MLAERARYLRDMWLGKGCNHPRIETEYFKGKRTGGQICTSCGKELTDEEIKKLENHNRNNRLVKAENQIFDRPGNS